ncbi:MAG: phosphatase PAP2 family protein [Candidatus Eremiobacteraeota bacterium]|nr:phosphatase PAP2 family protein [Candidatus Eremiobacteraeota bacterium]
MEVRLWLTALCCFAAFVVLGLLVAGPPVPKIDAQTIVLRGQATPLAVLFTASGRTVPLLVLSALAVVVFWAAKSNVFVPIVILLWQTVSQGAIEGAKHFFHRTRPDQWLVRHEIGYSYPSGHAATAVVFYAAWFLVVWQSPLPKSLKTVFLCILGIWVLGVGWSRIALGAHYFTDVLGGTLFGIAWLCIGVALARHLPFFHKLL